MKRTVIILAALFAVFSCSKQEMSDGNGYYYSLVTSEEGILFGLADSILGTKAGLEKLYYKDSLVSITAMDMGPVFYEGTKTTMIDQSNLNSFYVNTYNSSGVIGTNTLFSKTSSGNYSSNGGLYWPETDAGYKFEACNIQMNTGSSHSLVTVSNTDTDIVCAANTSPTYKSVNTLEFKHILSRVGTITNPRLMPCFTYREDPYYTLYTPTSGVYNVLTSSWDSYTTYDWQVISGGDWFIPKASSHHIYLYNQKFTYSEPGQPSRNFEYYNPFDDFVIRGVWNLTFVAGTIYNIDFSDQVVPYLLYLNPTSITIDTGETTSLTAAIGSSYLKDSDTGQTGWMQDIVVNHGVSWSSSNTDYVTVDNAGNIIGVAPTPSGSPVTITAYTAADVNELSGHTCTCQVTVQDYISGIEYRNLVVSISASPSTVSAAGGTSTLSYSTTWQERDVYASGATGSWTTKTATPNISGSATGFSRSGTSVIIAENTSTNSRSVTYTASYSVDNLSDSETVTITQGGAVIIDFDD